MNTSNAAEAMDPNPTTLNPTDTIECAADYIMKNRYRNLPVVDKNFMLLGYVRRQLFIETGYSKSSILARWTGKCQFYS